MTTSTCSSPVDAAATREVPSLLEPAAVAGLTLRNRFVMAPMTRARSPQGVPTAEVADYYRRRAEGGVGLIITEGTLIDHPSAGHDPAVPRIAPGAAEHGWRHVVEEVHRAGGKIAAQLWHVGSLREGEDERLIWSPSGVRETGARTGVAMTGQDIELIVSRFAAAARVAQRAGFDAVEVHGAHGYLVDEFLWAATNHRRDGYGGTRRNRARFAAEIVHAVRDATGPDFPIIFRFSQFKERAYTARLAETPTELQEIVEPIAHAGTSVFHASTRRAWPPEFPGSDLNLAGWTKKITGLPTITVGSVGLHSAAVTASAAQPDSLAALARRRTRGEFDLIAVGRPLLGNPDWVQLVATGRTASIDDYRKEHESSYR